jgi:hypothetical protein
MLLYHGTLQKFVPSIKHEGLKLMPQWEFHTKRPSLDRALPPSRGVYLTQNHTLASVFAVTKHFYFMTPPNQRIPFSGLGEQLRIDNGPRFTSAPVVLTVDFPESDFAKLRADEDTEPKPDGEIIAAYYPGVIPPDWIQDVVKIPSSMIMGYQAIAP